ncbi:hypothetical protein [Streptomyces sp. NBC_01304]|uniref:hypothetical protein n=1 Tax=Streptomyces sp. NBC_01304 TaxID=2903818 RepID=UPI002E1613E1|nr:hypothetical protein OG430_46055 [Streptomyces sp. NBC_01304]
MSDVRSGGGLVTVELGPGVREMSSPGDTTEGGPALLLPSCAEMAGAVATVPATGTTLQITHQAQRGGCPEGPPPTGRL